MNAGPSGIDKAGAIGLDYYVFVGVVWLDEHEFHVVSDMFSDDRDFFYVAANHGDAAKLADRLSANRHTFTQKVLRRMSTPQKEIANFFDHWKDGNIELFSALLGPVSITNSSIWMLRRKIPCNTAAAMKTCGTDRRHPSGTNDR